MALIQYKNGQAKEVDSLNTVSQGAARSLGQLLVKTADGLRTVWQSIRSCFGSGVWNNDYTWNNDDLWNNGN